MNRLPDESYHDYRIRRKREDMRTLRKLQPRMFWPSAELGTYVRTDTLERKGREKLERARA